MRRKSNNRPARRRPFYVLNADDSGDDNGLFEVEFDGKDINPARAKSRKAFRRQRSSRVRTRIARSTRRRFGTKARTKRSRGGGRM